MRRAAKIAGKALAGVIGIAGALALYVEVDGIPRYEPKPPDLHVTSSPERVARGKELATQICAGCHQDHATQALTGKHMADLPSLFGDVYSKNITQDPEKGIGGWTDGELAYFLRTGVRRDGQYVPPYMVKLPHISDEDMASLISFLRSDDPLVAPRKVDPPGHTKPSFMTKVLSHTIAKPIPYPTQPIATPPRSDRVAYGRYMTFVLDCYACHSADFKKNDLEHPERSEGYMGGGNALVGADKKPIYSANLTPDDETGIGKWSEADFVRAAKHGFRPDGRVLHYPMMPLASIEEDEIAAIYAYLRTIPKIHNPVVRPVDTAGGETHPGKKLYASYGCVACHGEKGVGPGGADLTHANERYPSDADLRAWIDDAPAKKPGTKMPGWKGIIKDEDYPPLMAYVRTLGSPPDGRQAAR